MKIVRFGTVPIWLLHTVLMSALMHLYNIQCACTALGQTSETTPVEKFEPNKAVGFKNWLAADIGTSYISNCFNVIKSHDQ